MDRLVRFSVIYIYFGEERYGLMSCLSVGDYTCKTFRDHPIVAAARRSSVNDI